MDKRTLRRLLLGEFSAKRLLRSLLFVYGFLLCYAFFFADRMIFQPPPASYQKTREILTLTSKDGTQISAIYLPNQNAQYTILYSHGNAEDIGYILPLLREIRDLGFAVFTYDYHGYGTSGGVASELTAYQDVDAAYDYLTLKLGIPPQQIIAYGRSVGGGSAINLAVSKPIAGLIVESSFITAFRVLTRIPILPFDKFQNIDKIQRVRCPVLIMHGKADEIVPFWHGQELFQATQAAKRFLWIDHAGHNDFVEVAGDRYFQALQQFALLLQQTENSTMQKALSRNSPLNKVGAGSS